MKTFTFTIITPENVLVREEASFVVVPGFSGELGILPGHMNLMALLVPGNLRIVSGNNRKKQIVIAAGIVDIGPAQTTLYTTMAREAE